ncbi:hypothetical protein [Vibrio maerlii]|nr:hypothetical protein [Vibrio maerlii]
MTLITSEQDHTLTNKENGANYGINIYTASGQMFKVSITMNITQQSR